MQVRKNPRFRKFNFRFPTCNLKLLSSRVEAGIRASMAVSCVLPSDWMSRAYNITYAYDHEQRPGFILQLTWTRSGSRSRSRNLNMNMWAQSLPLPLPRAIFCSVLFNFGARRLSCWCRCGVIFAFGIQVCRPSCPVRPVLSCPSVHGQSLALSSGTGMAHACMHA